DPSLPTIDTLSSILKGAVVTQPNGVDTVCLPSGGERERRSAARSVNRERRVDARVSLLALRQTYQAIILEANQASTRSAMLERATLADIAIVAVRLGRASCAADRALMERLEALGVPVLGVVSCAGAKPKEASGVKERRAFTDPAVVANRT
ncbi:MAG: hypothetical protein IAI50_12275, partial [Candidatus Eremiobacteraeota bacterium]|nr:hypothetical protein [Candidatus Eremiobacteraeota bacterium]